MKIENLFKIENKIAVVTGGSRGIGEMITAGFLANGVKVYISARKAPALIDKAKELSDKYQNECIPIPCDLSSMEGIKDFVQVLKENEDGIDFLINNFLLIGMPHVVQVNYFEALPFLIRDSGILILNPLQHFLGYLA